MNELALFAGAGGGILGGKLLGWNTIGAVEIEDSPRKTLLQRQRDGILGHFPIWDDIKTFDGRPWNGAVDIISGGFPCQDISAAGKGEGIDGARSGLWGEMRRVVCEVSPRFVFVENSPMLTSRGLHRVLGDLAEMGYNARWCVLGADDAGAPHRRKRIWILAYSDGSGGHKDSSLCELRTDRIEQSPENQRIADKRETTERPKRIRWWDTDPAEIPNPDKLYDDNGGYGTSAVFGERSEETEISGREICNTSEPGFQDRGGASVGRSKEISESKRSDCKEREENSPTEPQLGRVAYGVANRVDRLKAIGNGQVPAVDAIAFVILSEGLI